MDELQITQAQCVKDCHRYLVSALRFKLLHLFNLTDFREMSPSLDAKCCTPL